MTKLTLKNLGNEIAVEDCMKLYERHGITFAVNDGRTVTLSNEKAPRKLGTYRSAEKR